jgi:hypothetical protein
VGIRQSLIPDDPGASSASDRITFDESAVYHRNKFFATIHGNAACIYFGKWYILPAGLLSNYGDGTDD